MATNVVMMGARFTMNLGGPSLAVSTIRALNRYLADARYTLVSGAEDQQAEERVGLGYGVRVVSPRILMKKRLLLLALVWRVLGRIPASSATRDALRPFLEADLVLDTWGLSFADTLGSTGFFFRMVRGWFFVLGKACGKPVVKYTAAIGPCKTRWNRLFARLYLNHFCDLVMARDAVSRREVAALGIKTPVLQCPDTAFLMDAVETPESRRLSEIHGRRPVIGLSVSFQAYNRADSPQVYVGAMVYLIRHLVSTYGAHVVIIPNDLSSDATKDDRKVARVIHDEVRESACEILDVDNMLAEGIKGVIRVCDVLVAARYHSAVAGLSAGVPVLAIAWHHKYEEVLRLFGQEQYLFDIRDSDAARLAAMFDRLWTDRDRSRNAIRQALPGVVEQVYAGAERVAALLDKGR